jgi:hypothetical protein
MVEYVELTPLSSQIALGPICNGCQKEKKKDILTPLNFFYSLISPPHL